MSYIENIDRKKTIKEAKKELNHFSDLYALHQNYFVHINGATFTEGVINMMNYINYDLKAVNSIAKKDKQLKEILNVIRTVAQLPNEQEVHYIYYKYFIRSSSDEILNMMNISKRTMVRVSKDAHFNIALLLHIEVEKGGA